MNFTPLKFGAAIAATAIAGATLMSGAPVQAVTPSLAPGSFALQAEGNPTVEDLTATDTLDFSTLTFNISSATNSLSTLTVAPGGIKLVNPLVLTSLGTSFGTELFSNAAIGNFITGLKLGTEDVIFDLGSSSGLASFTRVGNNYTGSALAGTLRSLSGGSVIAEATIASLSFGGDAAEAEGRGG
jgi:hypothetical protein